MRQSLIKQTVAICLLSIGLYSIFSRETWAQVTPDNTLGGESSVIDVIGPVDFEIRGGAQRGANLFHSFLELGVPENGSVYFIDLPTTERIITRVTGDNASEIFGTLGVTGNADLFLLNPQGIVFGPNARLDVNGSFLASTANTIEFDNQGFFSANNPGSPPLLTIEPSALTFLQTSPAPIQNQANQFLRPGVRDVFGLEVPDGERLALIGGDVILDRGQVNAFDGHIFLGGLREPGTVTLLPEGTLTRLDFPDDRSRADVVLRNNATAFVPATGRGTIEIVADNITLDDSLLLAGIAPLQERSPQASGIITLDATDNIQVNNSKIRNEGDILSSGSGGDIILQGRNISILDGSIVSARSSTEGQAGRITVQAEEDIVLASSSNSIPPLIFNISNPSDASLPLEELEPGKIFLGGRSITLTDRAIIRTSSNNVGQAPNIQIIATDTLLLDNQASVQVSPLPGQGGAGNIQLAAGQLQLLGGASITAATGSNGSGGNIDVVADRILLRGISSNGFQPIVTQLSSSAEGLGLGTVGNAGNISVTTNQLQVLDGATISVSTAEKGRAGTINITADTLEVSGESQGRFTLISSITSNTESFGQPTGDAGNIILDVETLRLENGGLVSVSTSSSGQGGSIQLVADTVDIRGTTNARNPSALVSQTSAEGNAGRIVVDTRMLNLDNGGAIVASSSEAEGQGGDIRLRTETATLNNAFIFARTTGLSDNAGDAGLIQFEATDRLVLRGNSRVAVETLGVGDARNMTIEANRFTIRDNATVSAFSSDGATGDAGTLMIRGDRLSLQDNGRIIAFTSSNGDGGNIVVSADSVVNLGGESVLSVATQGAGRAGNINITTDRLTMDGEAKISATATESSTTTERGGRITVNVAQLNLEEKTAILSTTASAAPAGTLTIQPNEGSTLSIDMASDDTEISVSTSGNGQGGDLILRTDNAIAIQGPGSFTATTTGSGQAGSIEITGGNLILNDVNFSVESVDNATGAAGDILIAADRASLGNTSISAEPRNVNEGGDIDLQIGDRLFLNQSTISASTLDGTAGRLTLNRHQTPTTILRLLNSTLETKADGTGNAGAILLNAQDIFLTNSSLLASTVSGIGGDIRLNQSNQLVLRNDSELSATTNNGVAGNISIQASEFVNLNESVVSVATAIEQTGRLSLETEEGARLVQREDGQSRSLSSSLSAIRVEDNNVPEAGTLNITTRILEVEDGSRIAVNSPTGQAGNVEISTTRLLLDSGEISAATAINAESDQASANVNIDGLGFLTMENGSLIAADAQNQANGGNIILNAEVGFIVAAPNDNNDIIATAFKGDGGSIDITTQRLFGLQENSGEFNALRANQSNDMSVTSTLGTSGVISVNDLGIDPVQAAAELPVETAPPPLSQGCTPGGGRGNFVNAGQGGIPLGPGDVRGSDRAWEDISPPDHTANLPITEAQTWTINHQGQIVLQADLNTQLTLLTCRSF